jgi:hypothetical protein
MKVSQEGNMTEQKTPVTGGGKRPYASPVLTLFGHVAALTQSGICSAASDGNNAPCQVAGGAMGMSSDRRLKQDIVRIGDHPAGFGLYLYSYLPAFRDECGHGRQFGVMADEVEAIVPEAVTVRPDGYQAVYYDMLGIRRAVH